MQLYNHIGLSSSRAVKINFARLFISFFCYTNYYLIEHKHFLFFTVLYNSLFFIIYDFSTDAITYLGNSELHILQNSVDVVLTLSWVFITGLRIKIEWLKKVIKN